MIGRQLDDLYPKTIVEKGPEVVSVEHLGCAGRFDDVSFSIHAGEILGLAGVIGAGRTSIGMTLFGLLRPDCGTIRLDGHVVELSSPREALRLGIGYLPEDRKTLGLVLPLSLRHTMTHTALS